MKPITPAEVIKSRIQSIPDKVIEIFNSLITKYFSNYYAIVKQEELVDLITTELNISRKEVFDNGWLDVEDLYRNNNWNVIYFKPDLTENFEPYFKFIDKSR